MRNQRLNAPQAIPPARTWRIWAGQRRAPARLVGGELLGRVNVAGREATVKVCGVAVAMLQGHSWAPPPSNGSGVNVGTIPAVPSPAGSQLAGGKARRRLMPPGWGGGPVVVRGRESRPHGEGVQRVRSDQRGTRRSPVNIGAPWPDLEEAEPRVLAMQTKLHQWAAADPGRRFDDLLNLVYDPAFLVVAWSRVRGNKGARTAGVDGIAPRSIGARCRGVARRAARRSQGPPVRSGAGAGEGDPQGVGQGPPPRASRRPPTGSCRPR